MKKFLVKIIPQHGHRSRIRSLLSPDACVTDTGVDKECCVFPCVAVDTPATAAAVAAVAAVVPTNVAVDAVAAVEVFFPKRPVSLLISPVLTRIYFRHLN